MKVNTALLYIYKIHITYIYIYIYIYTHTNVYLKYVLGYNIIDSAFYYTAEILFTPIWGCALII